MSSTLFNKEIIIHSQNVVATYYSEINESDFNLKDSSKFDYSITYNTFSHKTKASDFLIILEFKILKKDTNSKMQDSNPFRIIVEGHYEFSSKIKSDQFRKILNSTCVSVLVSFLRTAVFNITSLTKTGGFYLPLIDMNAIHEANRKRINASKNVVSESGVRKAVKKSVKKARK